MPALVQKCSSLEFSLSYDGLTIYPQCDLGNEGEIGLAMTACNKLVFVIIPPNETVEGKGFSKSYDEIQHQNGLGYEKPIHRDDDNHDFYHQDSFPIDSAHFHLKFRSMLTQNQLGIILDIFHKHQLITAKEKTAFLEAFADRYVESKQKLTTYLTGFDRDADTKAIVKFVSTCSDNDILAFLHDYLLDPKFAYLRQYSGHAIFYGLDKTGSKAQTSESWAMIEKAFALQMEMNVVTKVSHFTPALAKECASQLENTHHFFAMPRKISSNTPVYRLAKHFAAFQKGNEDKLDESYTKHFKKFGS